MEIGITGGEEDGVDNSNVDNASLYTQPEDIYDVFTALNAISPNFSIAAAFGNVHGVYKPGNVVLRPEILGKHQEYAAKQLNNGDEKPLCVSFLSPTLPLLDVCRSFYALLPHRYLFDSTPLSSHERRGDSGQRRTNPAPH
jgi:hypothetical protein